jgi:hypothetical protein
MSKNVLKRLIMAFNPVPCLRELKKYLIQDLLILTLKIKNGVIMPRPSKLTPEIQHKIGENVSLGLTYSLAASAAGVTYQSLNSWLKRGQTEKSGKYLEFFKSIQKCNADGALNILQRLNDSAKAGDTRICMWILERRFPDEFGRRVYRKINSASENTNEMVEIIFKDFDIIRKEIMDKLSLVGEQKEPSTTSIFRF